MVRTHTTDRVMPLALVVLLVGSALFAGLGCRRSGAQGAKDTDESKGAGEQKIIIGFLVKQPEESWFQNEWKFAKQCADKYGFELVDIGATDGEKVLSAIDNLAARGAQGFVICTPDVRLGPAIMAKAEEHDMKVYTVDDRFVGPNDEFMDVHYMGISAKDIGRQVGKALYEEFQKRRWPFGETAACGITYEELDTAKQRTDGTIEALTEAGFPADRIYTANERTTDVPGAFDAASTVLTQHAQVKRWLVFSMNDEGVLGAVRAMEDRDFTVDTVLGIGIGGTTALEEFRKPEPTGFHATALISSYRHGYESTESLYKWIKDGVEPPKTILTEGMIVTRENCEKEMREQGLLEE